jgi:hypothetical protein
MAVIAIPLPGMLTPTAAIADFILPRVSFCRSKRRRKH